VTAALVALDALAYLLAPHHGELPPVLLDILLLVLLAPTLESALGHVRFCAVCLLGGLLAVIAHALLHGGPAPVVFGASGASAAVLGGYLAKNPRARVLTMVLVPFVAGLVELPAALLLGAWLIAQILLAGEGASYVSHAGAFAIGLILIGLLSARRAGAGSARASGLRTRRPR
jgi:membrane associated rhomboid family serine protease